MFLFLGDIGIGHLYFQDPGQVTYWKDNNDERKILLGEKKEVFQVPKSTKLKMQNVYFEILFCIFCLQTQLYEAQNKYIS